MSDETLNLLTSSDALDGYLAGLIGLFLLGGWAALRRRPAAGGGLFVVAAVLVALHSTHRVPLELLTGLLLLAIAALIPTSSLAMAMLTAVPGATALGAAFVTAPRAELVVVVVVAAAILAPLVAAYDEHDHDSATGVPLLALSMIGVFLTVPDTDVVVVVAAAAAPFLVAGPPLRLARLGRPGAQAGTGLVIWAVAIGGEARSAALIAGIAVLGLLVLVPVVRVFGRRTSVAGLPVLAIQATLCGVLSLIAGLNAGVVAALSVILLALAAFGAVAPPWRVERPR